jgi:hypothetical protein
LQKFIISIILLIFTFGLSSCVEEPTSIGRGLVDEDAIQTLVLDSSTDTIPQTSSTFQLSIPMGNSNMLMLGKTANIDTAALLIKFLIILPDTIREDVNNNLLTIDSAYVQFTQIYRMGEADNPFEFSVHEINSGWTSEGFTADSLASLSFNPNDELINTPEHNDTTLVFHLSSALALDWLKKEADQNLATDNGMILLPKNETDKVLGFQALSAGTTILPILSIHIAKIDGYKATLNYVPHSDISVVKGSNVVDGAAKIAVQSGIVTNSKIFFDVNLPTGSIVNSANLTLTFDSTSSLFGTNYRNSIEVFNIEGETDTATSRNFVELFTSNGAYTGDISPFVRHWINVENKGLLLKAALQTQGVDLFVFEGSAADPAVRPKLTITYTVRN